MSQSFSIELPPYWQDLCDAGKLVSDGWAFCNSFNTEMATGGIEKGNPPFEAGVSQRDVDYLHIFNWKKAAEAVAAGKAEVINGMKVLRIPTAVEEGVFYLAPEPKSPHGADVTPDGKYIVVAGKLDPHVTIYSFDKIQKAIADKKWTADEFGIPVLNFDDVMLAQVELGLGPLHTQFDDKGNAYTSLFLDSALAKWTLGGEDPAGYKLVSKTPVQYNIGHIAAAEGDTVSPDGQYLVALNKWSVDRFLPVGPLKPQNEQLLDINMDTPTRHLRHAHGHRRAALRPDDQGRQDQGVGSLSGSGLGPDCPGAVRVRHQARRRAHRARRQQRDGLHDGRSART